MDLWKKLHILMLGLIIGLAGMISSGPAYAGKKKRHRHHQVQERKQQAQPEIEKVAAAHGISKEELIQLPIPLRAFLYTLSGATAEILFTAAQTLHKNYNLEGYTQVWVFPLYALGALGVEKFSPKISQLHPLLRALIYMTAFYAIEFTGGFVAQQLTGECPWTYTGPTAFAGGILNGYHGPVWASLGMFAEQFVKVIRSLHIPKNVWDSLKNVFTLSSLFNHKKEIEQAPASDSK